MTMKEYMEQEEAKGNFCGSKLIQKSAEAWLKRNPALQSKYKTQEKAMELARRAYDHVEGFDGEPTSVNYMIVVMEAIA